MSQAVTAVFGFVVFKVMTDFSDIIWGLFSGTGAIIK